MKSKIGRVKLINRLYNKDTSIRAKILYIPLVIVLIGMIIICVTSYYYTKERLVENIKREGFYTAHRFVQQLEANPEKERFSYQHLVQELAISDEIEYAIIMDKDARVIASNYAKFIGEIENDIGSLSGARDGVPYSSEYYEDWLGETVYDVVYPIVINGKHMGAVDIGYSMDSVQKGATQNIAIIVSIGFVVFLLLSHALNRITKRSIQTMECIKSNLVAMASGDFNQQLPISLMNKKDELGKMAQSLDRMQRAIREILLNHKNMQELLYIEKEHFKTTLMSIGDGVICTDEKGQIILMNKIAEKLTGWKQNEVFGQELESVFKIVKIIDFAEQTMLISKNNKNIPIEESAAPIKNSRGEIMGVVIVFRDFTEKMEKQKQIEYLSFHDVLTGLYNRRYMEAAIKKLDVFENLPITIMSMDVNGLKLANDAFGHEMGDMLLKKIANKLKKVCGPEDILARMGGDEFYIIMPHTNHMQANVLKDKIIKEVAKTKLDSVIVSIAVGYNVKYDIAQNIESVIRNAENDMYEGKMKHGKLMRSKTIENVIRSINIKYNNEQVHTERVAQYCELIGTAMNFSPREVEIIKKAGSLHDIGKIIVPSDILNKKERLSEEEFEIIKNIQKQGITS